jgi:hypothetical protein
MAKAAAPATTTAMAEAASAAAIPRLATLNESIEIR